MPDGLGEEEATKNDFPKETSVATWDDLFNECRFYRMRNDLGENEHVVLLTDIGNDMNWFAAADRFGNNYFVHTSDWDYYLGFAIDVRFPIAYEVATTILHRYVSASFDDLRHLVHKTPKGCMSDLCVRKSEIILKMRTADICPECVAKIQDAGVDRSIVEQVMRIMDGIRESMTFRSRSEFLNRPSRLEIRGHLNRFFLVDLGDLEVNLTPRQRTLYMLFLNHPEGIMLSHLGDFEQEIRELYFRMNNQTDQHAINRAIKQLTDPIENQISTELSRIRKAFRELVGEKLASHYVIDGPHGEPKQISLDRSLLMLNLTGRN